MLDVISSKKKFQESTIYKYWDNSGDQVVSYGRGDDLLFVFNFHPYSSFTDYGMLVEKGEYEVILNTDAKEFGGFGLSDDSIHHFTMPTNVKGEEKEWIKLYLPSRTAMVLRRIKK